MEYSLQKQKTKSNNMNLNDQLSPVSDISELAKALVASPQAQAMLEQSGAKRYEDLIGKDGLIAQMLKPLMLEMLDAEMNEHLGYPKHDPSGYLTGNSRNGSYQRTLRSSEGPFTLDIPRDRNGDFNSEVVPPYKQISSELEQKIISMYAFGTSTADIVDWIHETYGFEVSSGFISKVTDKVLDLAQEWQTRPLNNVYSIAYLDAIHIKCRENNKVINKAVHIVLVYDLSGYKHILGHYISNGGEGARYWLSVITDLKNRGVQDIFIACVDGLSGFEQAIHSIFPQTTVQRCIVHAIRNSLAYVPHKLKSEFTQLVL